MSTPMSPVGVVVALISEAKALGIRHPQPGLNSERLPQLQVYISGMREQPAREAAIALADAGVAALLSFGTSGGLDATLAPGALVCPRSVVNMDRQRFTGDAAWRERLVARCGDIEIVDGDLLTTRGVLLNAGIKYMARAQSGAVAADLETAAVAAVAQERGLPFLALRAIVDDAETSLPDEIISSTDAYGRPQPRAFALALLKSPRGLFKLPGLARDFAAASAALRAVSEAAPDFGWSSAPLPPL
ncbi:MAG: purine phosphorylase [Nevskia sp.]